ncbi:MAG TPA: glycine zipper 2TM domain-containing protein [Phenylobacterium sp.]|uniref:glycine zipper 2TM domain-containing protein n=1 Tax=Phenylobacterium sp. TaxID=1871053 RepID=UPI002D259F1C|nr:glycine zipper 2TM domain-containing protein [Phenylobacterium sp.]HZZ68468.1 glycine zipper 2TM domain-containing protein [Phenylobacterium sp.]
MRNKLFATATLVCSALAVATAVPTFSQAQPERHRVRVCRDVSSRGSRNTGTVVGAVTGGLLGNALAHGGGKTGGTLIGAGVGAVAGHQIAKHNATHRVCHWEYR